jgi:hypothetical protein
MAKYLEISDDIELGVVRPGEPQVRTDLVIVADEESDPADTPDTGPEEWVGEEEGAPHPWLSGRCNLRRTLVAEEGRSPLMAA